MKRRKKSCANCKLFRIFAASKRNKDVKIDVRYLPEAAEFMLSIDKAAAKKLTYNVGKVCCGIKDVDIFKKLENTNIWEFRALNNGNYYRLLSFWDTRTETLIVATHGIVKKTQKTPKKEIEKAEAIRKNYFENN